MRVRAAGACLMVVVASTILMPLGGCSGSRTTPATATGPTAADGLANLRDLYRQAAAGKAAVPKSAADFAAVEPFYPVAGPFVLTGAIDCAWGAGLKEGAADAASRLLAWEKTAGEAGGWVMFQDGTIRQVTAAEVAAARKASP